LRKKREKPLDPRCVLASCRRMKQQQTMDITGAALLVGFAIVLAFNQVVIKVTNDGFQPAFQAGMRSVGAIFLIWAWMTWKTQSVRLPRRLWAVGVWAGLLFATEFICLFTALDLTSVARVSILFYSMPVWLAIFAHFLLPGEQLTPARALGLALAMAGVIWAVLERDPVAGGSILGDVLAIIAALSWAAIALTVRLSRLREEPPETQLFVQQLVAAPILIGFGLWVGDPITDPTALHWAGVMYQTVIVAFSGFLLWFYLVAKYSASGVASFSFLSPVFAVFMGWGILGERIGVGTWGALILVSLGLILINRKRA
jgi:drug/metabolite transporter (DMT)-like permease